MRNPRIEDQGLTAHWLRRGGQGRRHMAFDGTAGHHDLKRLLASVIVGGQAIPVQRVGLRYGGSQAAVFLGDRGFPRIQGIQLLLELKPPTCPS